MFKDEAGNTVDFKLPVDKCDLENSNFGIDENNETFENEELEKKEVLRILFETIQTVVQY